MTTHDQTAYEALRTYLTGLLLLPSDQPTLDFLTGDQARVGERLPWDSYDMLADHARALELVLHRADTRQLPTVALI